MSKPGKVVHLGAPIPRGEEPPPRDHELDAEWRLLGAVFQLPELYPQLSAIVELRDLKGPENAALWAAAGTLLAAGKPLNPHRVAELVAPHDQHAQAQLAELIDGLHKLMVSPEIARDTALFVRERGTKRRFVAELAGTLRDAAAATGDIGLGAYLESSIPDLATALGGQAERLKRAIEETEQRGLEPGRLATVWADELKLQLDKPTLVDGLLASTAMTVIYGESGAGKTFVGLDLACHIAAGLPWRGMAVEQGIVVYVAAEAPESVKQRLLAWRIRHPVDRLPVLVVTSNVDLLNGDATELAALLERIRAEHGRIALVVIDTLARAMTGNENAPEDMGRFVAACAMIREACQGHVAIIHHSGKDVAKGARGHSSLRAATDVEIEVTKGDGAGCIHVTKNRDGEDGIRFGFKLEVVELGLNLKGRMVTTCVAAESEAAATSVTRVTRLPPNMRVTYEALQAAIVDHGAEPPPAPDIPRNAKVVTVEQWREAAIRYLPQAELKQKNQAFKRSMEALVAQKLVRHVNGVVWIQAGKAVVASGHAGHAGHMKPNVTDVTATLDPGHAGHAGHTHSLECDPCDRDRKGRQTTSERVMAEQTESASPDSLSQSEMRERIARDTVPVNKPGTVFKVSRLKGGVEVMRGQVTSLYDGPDGAAERSVRLSLRAKKKGRAAEEFTLGGPWPTWLVAIEGHSAPNDFPNEPAAFNVWLAGWLSRSGAKVIRDYRQEAEAAGALDWMNKPAGTHGQSRP